ncbi:MAG: type II secretion system F family protein [Chloroflexota bacterium]
MPDAGILSASSPLLGAAITFVLVALLTGFVLARGAAGDPVAGRLDEHTPKMRTADGQELSRVNVLRDSALTPREGLAGRLQGLPMWSAAAADLRAAAMAERVGRYLAIRFGLSVALFLAITLLLGKPLFGLAGAAVGWFLPRLVVKRKASKRLAAFESQLAEALDLLVGALRAGHGFLQAIESTAREMDDPLRSELGRVIEQVNVGGSLIDALQQLTQRVPSYDVELLASAIAVQRQSGGNLAEILENLAHTVRERRRVKGEVKALTSGPKLSGTILGMMPVLMCVYFIAISDQFRATMLGTTMGQAMLGFAAVWTFIGWFMAQRVARVEY